MFRQFLEQAAVKGAVCGLFKVGWGLDENPEVARKWKTAFYISEGCSEIPRSGSGEPVMLFRKIGR